MAQSNIAPISEPIALTLTDKANAALDGDHTSALVRLVVDHDSAKAGKAAYDSAKADYFRTFGDDPADHTVEVNGEPRAVKIVGASTSATTDNATLKANLQFCRGQLAELAALAAAAADKGSKGAPSDRQRNALVKALRSIVGAIPAIQVACEVPTKTSRRGASVRITG